MGGWTSFASSNSAQTAENKVASKTSDPGTRGADSEAGEDILSTVKIFGSGGWCGLSEKEKLRLFVPAPDANKEHQTNPM
jgi:hypothetical protein